MERIQKAKESGLAIHHGYVCDGCGVSPIIGDLYKCSVLKDFDFCQQCEATKPHPHAFLKIKRPEQRPTAMFTVISDDKDKPHPKLVKQMKEQMKKCKAQFKDCLQNMKAEVKKAKKAQKKVKQDIQKQRNAIETKAKEMQHKWKDLMGDNFDTPTDLSNQAPQVVENNSGIAKTKAAKLMEFFQLSEEHSDKVLAFVMSQKANAEISELTNLFIDQVLPGLSMK